MRTASRIIFFFAALGSFAVSVIAQPESTEGFIISFPPDPEYLVLEYRVVDSGIRHPDGVPLLRIFGDGRVVRHYPSYAKKAGDWELRLSADEIESLMALLAKNGLMAFDSQRVKNLQDRAEQQLLTEKGNAWTTSAETMVEIGIRLERYKPPEASTEVFDFEKSVSYVNPEHVADWHPEIRELQGLVSSIREIETIERRNDFVQISAKEDSK